MHEWAALSPIKFQWKISFNPSMFVFTREFQSQWLLFFSAFCLSLPFLGRNQSSWADTASMTPCSADTMVDGCNTFSDTALCKKFALRGTATNCVHL
mmetsp:Transcript_72509/g.121803  ORF Transcript_72509/g.121803 Transcript_72509/m.121803 type:complete len:97 (+) Transcript_72509:941-1231(+)